MRMWPTYLERVQEIPTRLHTLYHTDCERCRQEELAYRNPANLDKIMEEVMRRVHAGELQLGALDGTLLAANLRKLWAAVKRGLPKNYTANEAYVTLAEELKESLYPFVAFKNHANIAAIRDVLFDGDQIRSFAEFKKLALPTMKDYNVNWLRAEYNQAQGSARMGAKWKDLEARGGKLQYVTVKDDHTRDEHRAIDGTVLPISHPFWERYYPPNGWNCRCSVRWRSDETQDVSHGVPDKVPAEMQFNPGKEGKAFGPNHPYEKILTLPMKQQVLDNLREFRNNFTL